MTVDDAIVGRTLGGIQIRRLLGRGGMGAVYEGYQEMLERKLAVKVMNPEHAQNPIAPAYFLREARSASRLRHPNIIQIYDFGEEDGLLYIAMEYIPGRPLDDIITDESPLPPERIVDILDQLLSALEEAHANKIIHRDIKPENLMIEFGRDGRDIVKVLDFGIAKPTEEVSNLTRQGAVMGTPQYMSPEQACGKPIDGRSDLFSVGVMLYEMLTELPPFYDPVLANLLIKLIQQDPLPPSAARPDLVIHPGLEAVCLRALRKSADQRYQNAADFRRALAEALDDGVAPDAAGTPKMFVFKRTAEGRPSGEMGPRPSSHVPRPTHRSSPQEEYRESEYRESASYVDTLNRSGFHTPIGLSTKGRGQTAYDFDISELKDDLLGQQTQGTVLCVHQRSSGRIDLEAQQALREAVASEMKKIGREFGGIVHTRRGHCIPMLFGVTSNQEDHFLRAAEAAFELRSRLRLATPEHVTFGFALSMGPLHQPAGGHIQQISGAPIDLAIDHAQAVDDELILAQGLELGEKLRAVFELEDGPNETATVLGVPEAHYVLRNDREFFGRDAELANLLGSLAGLGRAEGGGLILTGDAGMGKTAILGELARLGRQRGFHIVSARHRRHGAEGLRDLMRQWLTALAGEELLEAYPMLKRWLDGHRKSVVDAGGRQALVGSEFSADEALDAAFREFVAALGKSRPVVLIVDQIMAYDEGLAQFIAHWTAFCQSRSVLFAAAIQTTTGQGEPAVPEGAQKLKVLPLAAETSAQLLRHKLGRRVDPSVVDRLVAMAGGIPAYLHQLADHVLERLKIEGEDVEVLTLEMAQPWLARINSLGRTLHARLYAQPTSVRNVLALLSVLGSGARAQWVDALGSESWRVDASLQKLYDEDLIDVRGDDARLYFEPLIFERVVYEELPEVQRRKIHLRAAQYFDGELRKSRDPERIREYLVELVRHFEACDQYTRALEASHSLAIDSLGRFEYRAARQHFRKLLELVQHIPELSALRRAQAQLQLGRIERTLGETRAAIDLANEIYRNKALPTWLRNEAILDLAELWLDQEDTAMVENLVRRAVAEIRAELESGAAHEGGDWLLVRALKVLAEVLERQGKLGQAGDILLEAVGLNGQRPVDDADNPWKVRLLWEPLNQLGRLQLKRGHGDGAMKFLSRALDLTRNLGDVHGEISARANLASMHASQNRLPQAFENLSEALGLARRIGDLKSVSRLQYNLGLLYAGQYRWKEAREAFIVSRDAALALGWREGMALNQDQLRRVDRALTGQH